VVSARGKKKKEGTRKNAATGKRRGKRISETSRGERRKRRTKPRPPSSSADRERRKKGRVPMLTAARGKEKGCESILSKRRRKRPTRKEKQDEAVILGERTKKGKKGKTEEIAISAQKKRKKRTSGQRRPFANQKKTSEGKSNGVGSCKSARWEGEKRKRRKGEGTTDFKTQLAHNKVEGKGK